jgi:hypothetical protein
MAPRRKSEKTKEVEEKKEGEEEKEGEGTPLEDEGAEEAADNPKKKRKSSGGGNGMNRLMLSGMLTSLKYQSKSGKDQEKMGLAKNALEVLDYI